MFDLRQQAQAQSDHESMRDYLCLSCTRDYLAQSVLDGDDLSALHVESPTEPTLCEYCGKALPESRKRELKAENLVLRAKLAEAEAWVELDDEHMLWFADDSEKIEAIANEAIDLAHTFWVQLDVYSRAILASYGPDRGHLGTSETARQLQRVARVQKTWLGVDDDGNEIDD